MLNRREILMGMLGAAGAAAWAPCRGGTPASAAVTARYWEPFGDLVQCRLCPQGCTIDKGKTGICRGRMNRNGTLVSLGYANPCAVHVDPIEKKPFYHVLPGIKAYSLAIAGCNLRCKNCQNWTISQSSPLETENEYMPPAKVVENAVASGCAAIAYTYSEPSVWFEFMFDTAKLARKAGIKNVMVTSGFINEAPATELARYMDAATIDLKSFREAVYAQLNAGKLEPILRAVKAYHKAGVFIEMSTLVVPQWNDKPDDLRAMASWIRESLGEQTPFHLLRFFPMYQLTNLYPTPTQTLLDAQKIARDAGLKFVYVGNVAEADACTYCPSCGAKIISREGYLVTGMKITKGACAKCGAKINGIWRI
jgi:pyruvate formate lyase activating enzyme